MKTPEEDRADKAAYKRREHAERKAMALLQLGGKCRQCGTTERLRILKPRGVRLWSLGREEFRRMLPSCQLLCEQHLKDMVRPWQNGRPGMHAEKLQPIPNAHPLIRGLLRLMRREQMTWLRMSERSGVDRNTMSRWNSMTRGNMPLLDNIEAAVGVFDMVLCAVPRAWIYPEGMRGTKPDAVIDSAAKLRTLLVRADEEEYADRLTQTGEARHIVRK